MNIFCPRSPSDYNNIQRMNQKKKKEKTNSSAIKFFSIISHPFLTQYHVLDAAESKIRNRKKIMGSKTFENH